MEKSNSELLKELRNLSQAGMKDCKDALEEAGYNLEKAMDIIKIKGLNVVSGRSSKVASEGAIAISDTGIAASLVEVNSQTDFVAKNEEFLSFAMAVANNVVLSFTENKLFDPSFVEVERKEAVSKFKENIVVRRWFVEEAMDAKARVFTYTHANNQIGVLLTLLASSPEIANDPAFKELGNDLAMQIAAMSPLAIAPSKLDPKVLERQKAIFEEQLKELNKPEAAWPKILEGKMNKWFTEVCLENQESVLVPKTTIAKVVENLGTSLGGTIQLVNFVRLEVGEGIEVTKTNLADEVSKLSGINQSEGTYPDGSRDVRK